MFRHKDPLVGADFIRAGRQPATGRTRTAPYTTNAAGPRRPARISWIASTEAAASFSRMRCARKPFTGCNTCHAAETRSFSLNDMPRVAFHATPRTHFKREHPQRCARLRAPRPLAAAAPRARVTRAVRPHRPWRHLLAMTWTAKLSGNCAPVQDGGWCLVQLGTRLRTPSLSVQHDRLARTHQCCRRGLRRLLKDTSSTTASGAGRTGQQRGACVQDARRAHGPMTSPSRRKAPNDGLHG